MSEKDLDIAIEKCERIMEFDTRTPENPESENGYIFEKVYDLLQFLRQFQFDTDTNIGGNLIDRQAAIGAVLSVIPHDGYFDERAKLALEALLPAQPEQPSEIQDILDYLDTVLHPIVSPEHWNVYAELHDMISTLQSARPEQRWIPCSKKLPEMHDAGILKKVGIKQRSKRVYITIEAKRNDGGVERITDTDAELRDGEWYSDTLRWLKAAGKKIEVTAWMLYPEPYNPEGEERGKD